MDIKIDKKPFSISTNARILYKIIQLLLIMHYTGRNSNKTVPLLKIHLLIWVMQSEERKKLLLNSKSSNYDLSIGIWSIDENTNQALTYMYKDRLCNIDGKNYSLTENGKAFVNNIINDKDIFILEKEFLSQVGNSLNETKVNNLQNLWVK